MTTESEIRKLFADAPKRAIQIDEKVHVFIGADTNGMIERKIKHALSAGKTVIENGVSQWIEALPVTDHSKSGSDAYTWKDGNTLRVEMVLFIRQADGKVERKSKGFAWKNWSQVFGS